MSACSHYFYPHLWFLFTFDQVCPTRTPDGSTGLITFTCNSELPPTASNSKLCKTYNSNQCTEYFDAPAINLFCSNYGCEYNALAKKCVSQVPFSVGNSLHVYIVQQNATKDAEASGITGSNVPLQVILQTSNAALKEDYLTMIIPAGDNQVLDSVVPEIQKHRLHVVVGKQRDSVNVLGISYKAPTIQSIVPVIRSIQSSGELSVTEGTEYRTDGTSFIQITGTNFGTKEANAMVYIGTDPRRLCIFQDYKGRSTHDTLLCMLPEGSGKSVVVDVYINKVGLGSRIFSASGNALTNIYSELAYDPPTITSVFPSEDLPTSGYIYNKAEASDSTHKTLLVANGESLVVTPREFTYMETQFKNAYMHMELPYVQDILRKNIKKWAERSMITVVGQNFGPVGSEKSIELTACTDPDVATTCNRANVSSFLANNHTHLIFAMAGGTGIVQLDVLVGGKISLEGRGQKQSTASAILKYAPPKIDALEFDKGNGVFEAPTSGCAEYGQIAADSDSRLCTRPARMILHGKNFGEKAPKIFFTFPLLGESALPIEVEAVSNDHYRLQVNIPPGTGRVNVHVSSGGVDSNAVTFEYSKPQVSGMLSGSAIETARISDVFDARGLPENKIFIFGHNFGAVPSPVNITISGTACVEPSWHGASRFSSPPGMPYLSCTPGIHVVGSHSIMLGVAGTLSLITRMQSGRTIDARCPLDFYGKVGEMCVACWGYDNGNNIQPAANCTGDWVIRREDTEGDTTVLPEVPEILAAGDAKLWGRPVALAPKGSDTFTGTADPIALPGFQIFPPPECSAGGCLPDPALGSEVALPVSCGATKEEGSNIEIPSDCAAALVPGPFCHPYRFDGVCMETDPGVIECIPSSMSESTDDFQFELTSSTSKVVSKSPRLVCPHILPCEPKESCKLLFCFTLNLQRKLKKKLTFFLFVFSNFLSLSFFFLLLLLSCPTFIADRLLGTGGYTCATGYVSYYTAFNNIQETLNSETGARETTTVKENVCSPRHYTLPDGSCYAPRCGQCNPTTHFRLEGECAECPEYPWLMPLILVGVAVGAGIGMYFLTKKNVNLAVLSIGIDYFQVLGLFTRSRVKWPPEIKWLFRQFQWAMFDIDLTAPECAFRQFMTYENKFYIKLLLPVLGVTVIGLFLALGQAVKTVKAAQGESNQQVEDNTSSSHTKVLPQEPDSSSTKEEMEESEESKDESKEEKADVKKGKGSSK